MKAARSELANKILSDKKASYQLIKSMSNPNQKIEIEGKFYLLRNAPNFIPKK